MARQASAQPVQANAAQSAAARGTGHRHSPAASPIAAAAHAPDQAGEGSAVRSK